MCITICLLLGFSILVVVLVDKATHDLLDELENL